MVRIGSNEDIWKKKFRDCTYLDCVTVEALLDSGRHPTVEFLVAIDQVAVTNSDFGIRHRPEWIHYVAICSDQQNICILKDKSLVSSFKKEEKNAFEKDEAEIEFLCKNHK